MSIRAQKILRFIPVVNFLTVFMWLSACAKATITLSYIVKSVIKMMLALAALAIARLVCIYTINNSIVNFVILLVHLYCSLLVVAWTAVREQIKLIGD